MDQLPIGLQRLLKLADHLENNKMGHEVFFFGSFGVKTECGTMACAIGECPFAFPGEWEMDRIGTNRLVGRHETNARAAIIFFELDPGQLEHLFIPGGQQMRFGGVLLSAAASPKDVAANIRAFVTLQSTPAWEIFL